MVYMKLSRTIFCTDENTIFRLAPAREKGETALLGAWNSRGSRIYFKGSESLYLRSSDRSRG